MKRELASLTLHPEVSVDFFCLIELKLPLNENPFLFGKASGAYDIVMVWWKNILATHATGFYLREHS